MSKTGPCSQRLPALVGTPESIVASLLDYYDLGVTTFLSRGYEPLYDALDYGRWIIQTLREEVKHREQQSKTTPIETLVAA